MFATLTPEAARRCLSHARLALYKDFYGATDDRETLGALMWHQAVAAAMWPLVGLVEVVFRNRTHHALSMLHGGVASRNWYGGGPNDMRLKMRVQRKIEDILTLKDEGGASLVSSIDDFISETTFGIWIEVLYELHADRRYRFCKLAFPAYPVLQDKAAWTAPQRTWQPLIRRLERHKAFRDRMAHHGPLWKIPFEPQAGAPSILPSGPGAFILSLRREASALRTTIEEMEPGLGDFWDGAPKDGFQHLTTLACLHEYMGRALAPPSAPLS